MFSLAPAGELGQAQAAVTVQGYLKNCCSPKTELRAAPTHLFSLGFASCYPSPWNGISHSESHLLKHHPGAGQPAVPVVQLLNHRHFQLDAVNCVSRTQCQSIQECFSMPLKVSLFSALHPWKLRNVVLSDWQVDFFFLGEHTFSISV